MFPGDPMCSLLNTCVQKERPKGWGQKAELMAHMVIAVWSWASPFPSLGLGFNICKVNHWD